MTTLLLIRHAEHADFDQRLSGRAAGVPLTERGREQAAALARRVAALAPAAIWASPLTRTQETAAAIAAACGLALETRAALVEIDMGEWTGRSFASLAGDPAWDRWNAERATARIPGGETMAEAQARLAGAVEQARARYPDGAVALVTHSDLIRGAVCGALGLDYGAVHRFEVGPASVTRLVIGDWGSRLLSLNEEGA